MASKQVEKFLNSPMSSLKLTGATATKFLSVFVSCKHEEILQCSSSNMKFWCRKCRSCEEKNKRGCNDCLNGYMDLNKEEIIQLKNEFLQVPVKEWLTIDKKDWNNDHKTDCIGKIFLEKGFGYLCWWRIGTTARAFIFKKAVKDMGKDFVLSMPEASLPTTSNDKSKDFLVKNCSIGDLVRCYEPKKWKQYGPSFERALRALQEAGFTKKDGEIFDLDLKIESEADKLRAKYPRLRYREAKMILQTAKEEGWIK